MKPLWFVFYFFVLGAQVALGQPANLMVTSAAFASGQAVPVKYTCQGEDVSPPFKWDGAPANTKSFALICDDPDAPGGTWVHWVMYNLPPGATSLPEKTANLEVLPNGAAQGRNSFQKIGYGGPCPPVGKAHRYFFKVYALDTTLVLDQPTDKEKLLTAMSGHILAQGQLMGTYKRR